MQIKRVDDKPMVIHVKEKPKLHTKGKREAQLKGRAVLTITKGPKMSGNRPPAFKLESGRSRLGVRSGITGQRQTTATPPLKIRPSGERVTDKRHGRLLKTAGAVGARKALSNMEGGEEVFEAALLAEAATRPARRLADFNRSKYRRNKIHQRQNVKTVKFGSKIQKREAVSGTAGIRKTFSAEQKAIAVKGAKTVKYTKDEVKGGNAGGSASLAGMKEHPCKRMMKRYMTESRVLENKQNQLIKAAKKNVKVQIEVMVKKLLQYLGGSFLGSAALIAVVIIPLLAVIAMIYNSPFAIFFPSISSTETILTVLDGYVAEFNQSVDAELNDISGYDWSEKVFVNYEGTGEPDNYYDILGVYMVKYGIGDTATDMTDLAKANLKLVFNDLRQFDVTSRTETETDSDGNDTEYQIKCVNVTMKSYLEMASEYGFNDKQNELLLEIMKPESLAILGRPTGGAGPGSSNITSEQYQAIMDEVSDENGKKVVAFVLSKVGYPYSQDNRDTGNYFDCSSLAYYAWRQAGVSLLYEGSNTAASEGKFCYDNNLLVEYEDMEPGDLIFYSYSKNGRFLDISHVAVYVGDGMVVEAANERTGVVYRSVQGKSKIVMIGRPR